MNVALPAFVIFLLLLPGFIFRTQLKRAERTSLDYSPFGQVAAEAVMWALMAHLLWLSIGAVAFLRRLEPTTLMNLLGELDTPSPSERARWRRFRLDCRLFRYLAVRLLRGTEIATIADIPLQA